MTPWSGISRAHAKALAPAAGAYGGVAAAALAGLVGILYFIKAGEVTGEEAKKQRAITEAATKEHNDNNFSLELEEYLAEMSKIAAVQKKARYERSCKKAVKEATKSEAINDEASMKALHGLRNGSESMAIGKRYKSKEEKAQRYELFKAFANMVDKATVQGGAVFVTNHTADWTEEECQCLYDSDVDWDDYIDHIRSLIDKQNAKAMKASRD